MERVEDFCVLYQVKEMDDKLVKLRKGVTLIRSVVSKEPLIQKSNRPKAIEEMYLEKLSQWKKRKRMFKDVWDAITENSPKDLKEIKELGLINIFMFLLEELGLEYDEDGVSLQSFSDLLQHGKKRAKGQAAEPLASCASMLRTLQNFFMPLCFSLIGNKKGAHLMLGSP
ncbi:unnamed protein product [Dovyalis caffra]|uniref:Leucine zipper with capping helix domain-containing protein n=1 Tax=Dovyalis caffra TaxID=77055 RepID=A0AAV1QXK6_9ROSI|nr:unnamed protein product [Dovyalis caffra]